MSDELSRVLIKKIGEVSPHRKARESYFVREMITNRFKKFCEEKRCKKKNPAKAKSPSKQVNEMAENGSGNTFKVYSLEIFAKKEVWHI